MQYKKLHFKIVSIYGDEDVALFGPVNVYLTSNYLTILVNNRIAEEVMNYFGMRTEIFYPLTEPTQLASSCIQALRTKFFASDWPITFFSNAIQFKCRLEKNKMN